MHNMDSTAISKRPVTFFSFLENSLEQLTMQRVDEMNGSASNPPPTEKLFSATQSHGASSATLYLHRGGER